MARKMVIFYMYFLCSLLGFINGLNSGENILSVQKKNTEFVGAVFEFAKIKRSRDEGDQLVIDNLKEYRRVALDAASQGAQIIVFPEDGIFPTPATRSRNLGESVPNPKKSITNPCLQKSSFTEQPVLTNLSCLAIESGLYVVANTIEKELCNKSTQSDCPKDGKFQYNTDVVFNSKGELVARHRKRFLFFEMQNNRAPEPQLTVFDTEFGRFGVVICFDTMFVEAVQIIEKYQVDTMLVSTYWFDELPFLSAIQFFQSFAVGNGVNLLVANIHIPSTGSIGSVIVSKDGSMLEYTHNPDGKSKLLVANVPATPTLNPKTKSQANSQNDYKYKITNMDNYTVVPIDSSKGSGQVEACNNGLCCSLRYSSSKITSGYYLAARDGFMSVQNHYFWCQQVCSVFSCQGEWKENKFSCKSVNLSAESPFDLELSGNMTTKHIYPSVLSANMTLLPSSYWEYQIGRGNLKVSTKGQPLVSATLYGRCYDRDPPYKP